MRGRGVRVSVREAERAQLDEHIHRTEHSQADAQPVKPLQGPVSTPRIPTLTSVHRKLRSNAPLHFGRRGWPPQDVEPVACTISPIGQVNSLPTGAPHACVSARYACSPTSHPGCGLLSAYNVRNLCVDSFLASANKLWVDAGVFPGSTPIPSVGLVGVSPCFPYAVAVTIAAPPFFLPRVICAAALVLVGTPQLCQASWSKARCRPW